MPKLPELRWRVYPNGAVVKYGLRGFNREYLNRTEQLTIAEFRAAEPCRFHTRPADQPVIKEFPNVAGGMVLQGALNLSHEVHGLVRPLNACWEEKEMRTLGGRNRLLDIFETILMPDILSKAYVRLCNYNGSKAPTGISVSDFHIHHLVNPDPDEYFDLEMEGLMIDEYRRSDLVVAEFGDIKVVAESIVRVGQCHIVQTNTGALKLENLIDALCHTIGKFSRAFPNTAEGKEGLPPDFQLMLEFRNGKLHFGTFNPYLAGLGIEMLSGMRMGPSPHQWTPESTVQLLNAVG